MNSDREPAAAYFNSDVRVKLALCHRLVGSRRLMSAFSATNTLRPSAASPSYVQPTRGQESDAEVSARPTGSTSEMNTAFPVLEDSGRRSN